MAARQGEWRAWHAEELTRLRALLADDRSYSYCARALGRTRDSIRQKAGALGIGPLQRDDDPTPPATPARAVPADDAPAVQEWRARRRVALAEVETGADHRAAAYDWMRPVELPAPPAPRARMTATPRDIIAGDFHWPHQSDEAEAILLQVVAALRPRRFILNGDGPDLLAVSRYPKDARRGMTWPLRDEVAAMHAFLHRLHAIGDAWGMEVVETEANHSGNGLASRWWRYLSDRVPELLGHDEAEERLSYASWFYPKWSSIRLVDHIVIADDLLVIHGDMSRKHGAYTARAHAEKWVSSVLHNHTHRMGSSLKRVPAIAGLRGEGLVRAYENGCMCRLDPSYATAVDWCNGFSIVTHHPEGDARYSVEQVVIDRGRAVVGALGGELAA